MMSRQTRSCRPPARAQSLVLSTFLWQSAIVPVSEDLTASFSTGNVMHGFACRLKAFEEALFVQNAHEVKDIQKLLDYRPLYDQYQSAAVSRLVDQLHVIDSTRKPSAAVTDKFFAFVVACRWLDRLVFNEGNTLRAYKEAPREPFERPVEKYKWDRISNWPKILTDFRNGFERFAKVAASSSVSSKHDVHTDKIDVRQGPVKQLEGLAQLGSAKGVTKALHNIALAALHLGSMNQEPVFITGEWSENLPDLPSDLAGLLDFWLSEHPFSANDAAYLRDLLQNENASHLRLPFQVVMGSTTHLVARDLFWKRHTSPLVPG
ncbi:hypothetical protein NLJ89_g11252 [Agrocybe chaxingu]|uniref:Uncharacterized protein n=1 Tax=Agrocybe chaxingu TaxID=84603 RepID=A0A9W8JPK7_9AGAR|nr:hypothetical protein NLJ89_g11252 [Agrocybe chaxingu]